MSKLANFLSSQPIFLRITAVVLVLGGLVCFGTVFGKSSAQSIVQVSPASSFRIGEKLTYSVTFGRFPNAGYAETHVLSRGKISGKDAVEIRSKVKTLDLVSAAFFMFDESRTVYAAPETGLPLYISSNSNDSVLPKETITNFLAQPTTNFDLVTVLFKMREAGGIGTFPLFEGENNFTVSFVPTVSEKVKTQAGEFETTVTTVQSDYLTANGIKDLRINLSNDEFHVPVLIRFKVPRGEFRAAISGILVPEPETPTPTATPAPVRTATPPPTPKATATPISYVDNMPLAPELGFQVGESLDYRITTGGKAVAVLNLSARERKRVNGADSLTLAARITGVEQGNVDFRLGDSVVAQVDPETLAPMSIEAKLGTPYGGLNPLVTFDVRTGSIKFGPTETVDAPIGTHSIVSLIYAMRSFNLKPSKDRSNPVNDTRVAVFWDTKAYVFTLRPTEAQMISIGAAQVPAQLITINTGHPELDKLGLRVWLGTEDRVPVRFSAGAYQADLITRSATLFK